MQQVEEQKVEEVIPQPETKEPTQEEKESNLRAMAEMQHKALSQLLGIHLEVFLSEITTRPRVTEKDKILARKALIDAITGVADFGLGITKVKIPETGVRGKKVVQIAGILAQLLDNRMLLLAQNLKEQENEQQTDKENENVATATE